jgi:hypothetical protein
MTTKLEIRKKDYIETNISMDSFLEQIPYIEYPKEYKNKDEYILIFDEYTIKCKIKINSDLQDPDFLYFIYNKKNKLEYVAFNIVHPELFYKIENNQMTENILNVYNNKNYKKAKDFEFHIRGYIGSYETINMTFNGIIRYILLNKYTEKILWNEDIDYNKRGDTTKLSTIDLISTMTNIIDDEDSKICFYTKFSKSLIKIENYNNSFIVDIRYNGIINKNINSLKSDIKNYQNNMPVDIISMLSNFNFITLDGIFWDPKNISIEHLKLSALLIDTNITNEIENLKQKIISVYDLIEDEHIKLYAKTMKIKLDLNIKLDKMEKNGFFNKFEDNMIELIANAYDQFNTDDSCKEDEALSKDCAAEIMKYKINEIIAKIHPF